MKKLTLTLILLVSILCSIVKSQTNIFAGNISGTWTLANSPYRIYGDINIANGTTLTIQPGVAVTFQGHYKLNVQGCLLALGSSSSMINFTATNPTIGWKGIRFDYTRNTNDSSKIVYCKISYGKASVGSSEEKMGGAIFTKGVSKLLIQNNIISNNLAYLYGGGICCRYSANPRIINNVICNNTANSGGGGIYCFSSSNPFIINNTIANNSAGSRAGIYANGTNPIIRNCIVWGNTPNSDQISPSNLSSVTYSNVQNGYSGTGNINSNPIFNSATSGAGYTFNGLTANWSLQSSSPCINAASDYVYGLPLPGYDVAGNFRIDYDTLDIGAYEYMLSNYVCGNITSNTTWSGFVKATCNVVVNNGVTLTILPGTNIEFLGHYKLDIQGTLLSIGTFDSLITFTSKNTTTGWHGIRFEYTNSTNDTSKIEYTTIQYGNATGSTTNDKYGGGIFARSFSKLIVRNSIIANCSSQYYGGGICLYYSLGKIINNVIVNNESNISYGGGIYILGSSSYPFIYNNTIANNSSTSRGAGIYVSTGTPSIKNNILWGNVSSYTGVGKQLYPTTLSNIQYNDIEGGIYTGTGNISTTPVFKTPSAGAGKSYNGLIADWSLLSSSLCINAGTPSSSGLGLPSYDLNGKSRVFGTVDIGAYEDISTLSACGTISANTTWNANTVNVTCDVIVNDGVTLTIFPGTKVIFQGQYKLEILGSLIAVGTSSDTIEFTAQNTTTGWKGIRINNPNNTNDSTKIRFCKIQYGKPSGNQYENSGGGIYVYSFDKVIIDNCLISQNATPNVTYGNGGGINVRYGNPTISNNTIENNFSKYGGGFCGTNFDGLFFNNTISNNSCSQNGGGIYLVSSDPLLTNNKVSNNIATSYGGGLYVYGYNTAIINNNSFVNNTASKGGGICVTSDAPPSLNNNTIANNLATTYGGGFYLSYNADPVIKNCILYGNSANSSGNQFYLYDPSSDPKIYYSDIQGGTAAFAGLGSGANYANVYQNNVDVNPPFTSPFAGAGTSYNGLTADWSLQTGSKCINTGTLSTNGLSMPSRDLAGNTRIYNGRIDIGAYENQQGISVCGTISENTVWDADTIEVNCDITVNDSATLSIFAGTFVKFLGPYKITVNGCIQAVGTASNMITFGVSDTTYFSNMDSIQGGWKGIQFVSTPTNNDSSKFVYCLFKYGKATGASWVFMQGGALHIYNTSKILISNCIFNQNRAGYRGGAVYIESASPTIINSVFCNNSAYGYHSGSNYYSYGGAMYIDDGNPILANNTIVGNIAQMGGGLYCWAASPTILNTIIYGNDAYYQYSNYYKQVYLTMGSAPDFYNCDIQGGKTQMGTYTLVTTFQNCVDVNPEFNSISSGIGADYSGLVADWKIKPTSFCINTGKPNTNGLFSEDLAGNQRIVADTIDIGAYECPMSRRFITSQPSNQAACVGTTATYSVSVSIPAIYQWQKDGINIPGANNSSLIINPVSLADTGNYACVIGNLFGGINCDTVSLTVNTHPLITANPVSTATCYGQSASFSASATGSEPISYQWFNTNGMIAGATNNTYTINAVSTNDISTYYCVATNNCGFGTSSGAALTINTPPTVTSIQSSTTVCEGNSISFTTSATGTSPIQYQWYDDNGAIIGDTGVQYQIAYVSTSHAGNYYCKATNLCGTDSTNSAILNVNTSPNIISQSNSSTRCEGQNMTFSITATGTPPLSYEWYFGGILINGANNNTYSINSVSTSDDGNYYCKALNTCGNDQSTNISLTVNQSPTITTHPSSNTKCIGQSTTFSVTASGTAPLSYQWYDNNGAITGATNNTYSINTVSASHTGYYYCIVSNSCGNVQSNNAVLTVQEAPVITSQSSSTTRCVGQSMTFSVAATGTSPLTYQWYYNSSAISGAVNNTYTINSINTSDAGSYYCIVTNSCGTDQSNSVTLTVNVPPTIISQTYNATKCVGQSMTFSTTATGTAPITYQWYYDTNAISSATNSTYTINSITTNSAGNYYCIASNSCGNAQSSIKTLSVNTSPAVTSQSSNSTRCVDQSMTLNVTSTGTAPLSYQWFNNSGAINGAANNIYSINSLSTSDAGNYYCIVTNVCGTDQSNNINLVVNEPPVVTSQSQSSSVCEGQSNTFSITTSGTAPITYQWYYNGASISAATNNTYTNNSTSVSDAGNYYCIANNSCGTAQSLNSLLTINTSPIITTYSNNSSRCRGQNIVFNVTSVGTGTISYQWYYNNVAITGGANNFHLLSSITPADAGNYHCIASNLCGTDQGKNINLIVNEPITILSQSGDSSRCTGETMTFDVNVSGTSPISYQWYFDTFAILNSNFNSFKLQSLNLAHNGIYRSEVTNICGVVNSTKKNLSVHPIPIVSIGNDSSFCKGGNVILSPGNGYTCKWNNGSINPEMIVTESGSYYVHVTDAYNCQNYSDTVNIDVHVPYTNEEICLVTIDPPTGKNLIVWERTSGQGIVGYNIYKESVIGGQYQLIGNLAFDSLSVWVDNSSNPKQRADRYMITTVDTCNNESAPSPVHKTIHLTASEGTSGENNLNWNHYEGFSFGYYKIYKGTNPSNLVAVDSIQSTLNSWTDISAPTGVTYYQVSAVKYDTCFPAIVRGITKSGPYSQSLSNIRDYSNSPGNYLTIDPSTITLDSNAGSDDTVNIYTNTQYWSASADEEWISLTPNLDDGTLTITANTENTESIARNGTVVISSDGIDNQSILVYQLGKWGSIGIEESSHRNKLIIYPNPFSQSTNIILPRSENSIKKVEVFGINGELIKTIENIKGNRYELFKSDLSEGLYFIRVIADKIYYEKVVVE